MSDSSFTPPALQPQQPFSGQHHHPQAAGESSRRFEESGSTQTTPTFPYAVPSIQYQAPPPQRLQQHTTHFGSHYVSHFMTQTSSGSSSVNGDASTAGSSSGSRGGASGSGASGGGGGSGAYECPNCGKRFARDDLLRRHLAREARALAQPSFDRQKSCQSCASSKARCDLEVPSCGRCRARGKVCVYGPRSGNPNVRRAQRESMSGASGSSSSACLSGPLGGSWSSSAMQGDPMGGVDASGGHWGAAYNVSGPGAEGLSSSLPHASAFPPKREGSGDDYSSDDSHGWSDHFHGFRIERSYSGSEASESGSVHEGTGGAAPMDYGAAGSHASSFLPYGSIAPPVRTQSPAAFTQPGPSQQQSRAFGRVPIDTNVVRRGAGFDNEEGEETPIAGGSGLIPVSHHHHMQPHGHHSNSAPGAAAAMGPPLAAASQQLRFRNTAPALGADASWAQQPQVNAELSYSTFGAPYAAASPISTVPSLGGRPQPPRLLTGSRMPAPAGPASAKSLFSAQLDLSGWLEEPVVPSPLYRMGPSLASFGAAAATSGFLPPTPISEASANATRQALLSAPRDTVMRSNSDPGAGQGDASTNDASPTAIEEHLTARYWWSNFDAANNVDMQSSVAQTSAGHFTLYPALLILPDASSPVPPLIHRPWLAQARLHTPTSLAVARVVIAGYHTRLPSSEAMIWGQISAQTQILIDAADHMATGATDLEVFAATAALWLYSIMLLMSIEPTVHVDVTLVDRCLIALSTLAKGLSQRVRRLEDSRRSSGSEFLSWGFEETCRRTLFASYALLVLQRFRDTTEETQSRLADAEIILDVALPAGASEFEAGSDLEWRAAQSTTLSPEPLTLRTLLSARTEGGTRPALASYFDRHDDFTNVVLSVAFALDRRLAIH